MKSKALTSAIAFLVLAVTVFAQNGDKDEQALRLLAQKMADAQIAFDAAVLDRIFTPDYIEISPAGEFDPRDKVLDFYKPEAKPAGGPEMKVDLSEFSIRNYGDFAIVIVKQSFVAVMDGKPSPPRSMRATLVCRKENRAWKIASAQYTGVRPPQQKPQ